jgi:hypothetical protein
MLYVCGVWRPRREREGKKNGEEIFVEDDEFENNVEYS